MIKDPHFGGRVPPVAKPRNPWIPLSGNDRNDRDERRRPAGAQVLGCATPLREVVVAWLTTARYTGPWRQPQRVPEMLFSEQQYRSWALLAR